VLTLSSFYACGDFEITPTTADAHRQTQTRLHLRGSQIRLLPGNQIGERESWEDEGILYTRGNPKKITAFWRSHL